MPQLFSGLPLGVYINYRQLMVASNEIENIKVRSNRAMRVPIILAGTKKQRGHPNLLLIQR